MDLGMDRDHRNNVQNKDCPFRLRDDTEPIFPGPSLLDRLGLRRLPRRRPYSHPEKSEAAATAPQDKDRRDAGVLPPRMELDRRSRHHPSRSRLSPSSGLSGFAPTKPRVRSTRANNLSDSDSRGES